MIHIIVYFILIYYLQLYNEKMVKLNYVLPKSNKQHTNKKYSSISS